MENTSECPMLILLRGKMTKGRCLPLSPDEPHSRRTSYHGIRLVPASPALTKLLLSHGQFFDSVQVGLIPETGSLRHVDGSARADSHLRADNVLRPIAPAGRNVSRKSETRERGHGYVVGAPDAGFEHPPAPKRDVSCPAQFVKPLGGGESSHASKFHIDNLARAQFNGLARVVGTVNRLIQAIGVEISLCSLA